MGLETPCGGPEGTKQLLAEMDRETPVPIEITVTNSPSQVRIAQIPQAQANEEVDRPRRNARVETDQAARVPLYAQAQRIIADEALLLFLVIPQKLRASVDDITWTRWSDGAFQLQFTTVE
ncbi:hypothetical protein [Jannaschia rubra]|uniref:hypothetical protein n=1 Tax=Jannaschia rubra TaxID=282197 RepID=UPI002491D45A|nr:hypothetical protein [Jannaschia rubra]